MGHYHYKQRGCESKRLFLIWQKFFIEHVHDPGPRASVPVVIHVARPQPDFTLGHELSEHPAGLGNAELEHGRQLGHGVAVVTGLLGQSLDLLEPLFNRDLLGQRQPPLFGLRPRQVIRPLPHVHGVLVTGPYQDAAELRY